MSKIHKEHLEKAAYIYIRQSTMTQVQQNVQSQRCQYDLEEKARQLGFREIRVIDDDLGCSGSVANLWPGAATVRAPQR
jgi:DNA invertase Pin-like site-specific DNA recombinase